MEEVISRSVDLGYEVVQDYMDQAQRAASRLRKGSAARESWAEDAQELATRTAKYASDLITTWLQLLEIGVNGMRTANGEGPRDAEHTDTDAAEARRARRADSDVGAPLLLEIASSGPATVSLELRPGDAKRELVVHALRSTDPKKPRLKDVGIRAGAAGDPPVIWLRVPPRQPPGNYEGLIVEQSSNRPVGSLRVSLGEKSGRARTRSSKVQPGASQKRAASRSSARSKPSSKRS